MLNPDISARDALDLLSVRDDSVATRGGLDRRRFLQLIGMGLGGGALIGNIAPGLLPGDWRDAFASGPLGPQDGVLVIIGLYGGNDGLNTVVPYSNPRYREYRANIAHWTSTLNVVNDDLGLHPNLKYVKSLWDAHKVAVVQGLGYPNPDLSHFNSMAYWMSGVPSGIPTSGWIGRWLDGIGASADLYTAGTIGSTLPLHLVGQARKGTAIPDSGFDFGSATGSPQRRMYDGVRAFSAAPANRGPWHDAIADAERGQLDLAARVAPIFTPQVTADSLAKDLTVAARLINADLGFRVLDTSLDSFDHHEGEPSNHGEKMQQLDDGIRAFFATLDPKFADRVTIMTFSEFGRTPWSNDSQGTDHGTAAPHFVIGNNVQGGIYGQHPSLSKPNGKPLDRWERMAFTTDYRSLYATMIEGLLGGGSSSVLGGSFPTIPLFRVAPADPGTPGPNPGANPGTTPGPNPDVPLPGGPLPDPTLPPTESRPGGGTGADLVGIVPLRLLDTRIDPGLPIGAAAAMTLPVAGTHDIPSDAVAAVLNVTAVGATGASYVTVWPTGLARPDTSSLNVRGGDVVPNLVITKLGGGSVDIYNNAGDVHCVVDIVGYFTQQPASRFTSLAPSRVLDTRSGLGAPAGAVGAGRSIDVQVAGTGGVSGAADTVVLNVTVTEPSGEGYVTVWPTGAEMPTASNLNFVPGQTVPNLVVAKLGGDGSVSLYNSAGSSHLIADVLGSFGPGDGARLTPIAPARLLDTRTDEGMSRPVGQTPLLLPVLARGGVPASGVTAVVLNVTATDGTGNGYVTVFPSGQDAPTASNLNITAGESRANLVIAKVGPDGAVAMFNSSATVHLIADVVGYFTL